MGILFSKIFGRLIGSKEVRILILGLDNAGKTTILYRLHQGEVVTTIPTIGFNVETVTYKNIRFQVWDLGGQSSIRPYWRCYYPNTNAIIYVVDSADVDRVSICKDELLQMLEEDELKDAALCVFANKQDLPGALTSAQVSEALGLTSIKNREWQIFQVPAPARLPLTAFFKFNCDRDILPVTVTGTVLPVTSSNMKNVQRLGIAMTVFLPDFPGPLLRVRLPFASSHSTPSLPRPSVCRRRRPRGRA
mmetsp:Transcript_4467/g.9065  ORF Transcript_4467/g.9065 Transcript_4467/m.9065 type:complete len:248 (-) Transcript_4467:268-1011(-)